jgi:hypothetical protein
MNTRRFAYLLLTFGLWLGLGGCATTPHVTLVSPGPVEVGSLTVTAGTGWNDLTASKSPQRAAWTRDGLTIDRLWVFADIADGETLYPEPKGSGAALPRFRATMLPNELVAFTESYIGKLFGEGDAVVTTSNLRPHRFGAHNGVMFDAAVEPAGGADRKGLVGAFIADDKLFLVMYLAVEPYYFDLNRAAATEVIVSGRR